MAESQQIAERKKQVMDAFEIADIQGQLDALLSGNKAMRESFKTKMIAISLDSQLKTCAPETLIQCGMQALKLNLPMQQGQGYVVNYGGEAKFDIGYKGWRVLAKRGGYDVLADAVYVGDTFRRSGYGHHRKIEFEPAESNRNSSDDAWCLKNIKGVIVSIFEIETKLHNVQFVDREKLLKIRGKSPSTQSERGLLFSPHAHWAEEMMLGKAIKSVISKMPIDVAQSELSAAIDMVNQTEAYAQSAANEPKNVTPARDAYLSDDQFHAHAERWKPIFINGYTNNGRTVEDMVVWIEQLGMGRLTTSQKSKINNWVPLEGESQEIEPPPAATEQPEVSDEEFIDKMNGSAAQ